MIAGTLAIQLLSAASRGLDRFETTVMVTGMALVTIITCIQVVLRYVFNSSIDWAEEFTRYAII